MRVLPKICGLASVAFSALAALAQAVPLPDAAVESLHAPPGFVIERVAAAPLVRHPMMACFDDVGRLYVADSAGLNPNAQELLKDPPSRIQLLESTHGDGVFDKATTFADKLVFPQGVAWLDGAVYTASPPSLWRLRDTRGGGVADERTELVSRFGFTGNAADIHGPVVGPDGRLYWCDGRHGHDIPRPGKSPLRGLAARIFRCKPDGSDVEVICGGGMDNPVKCAFSAEGEAFVGVNLLHAKPQRIDGIIYAQEGATFPYATLVLGEFRSTGELFEPVDNLGWVAVAGILRYRGNALGEALADNLFSCQFNPHRVQRHIVKRLGAGFALTNEDFLTCANPDFHPTDVLQDADGSLLVIDTGGWFRIGCPTSQIARPQIEGAIYRIRRKDAARIADPWGRQIAWEKQSPSDLAKWLGDARPAVADRAVAALAKFGREAAPTIRQTLLTATSPVARRNALWVAARTNRPEAMEAARVGLTDEDPSVRQTAATVAGLFADATSSAVLTDMLTSDTPPIRRQAAEALGRIGNPNATSALLSSLKANGSDRFIEHATIFALIRLDDRFGAMKFLKDPDAAVRRGALIALDQMPNGGLRAEMAAPMLSADDPRLRQTAARIVASHPRWAAEMQDYLRQALDRPQLSPAEREELKQQIAELSRWPGVQQLVADVLGDAHAPDDRRVLLLEAMAQSPLASLPDAWQQRLAACLADKNDAVARQAIYTARLSPASFADPLQALASDAARGEMLRVEAIDLLAPRMSPLGDALFDHLVACLDAERPPMLRSAAATALGHAHLTLAQLQRVSGLIATAGPLELPGIVAALGQSNDGDLGIAWVEALQQSPAAKSLRLDAVNDALKEYPPQVKQAAIGLLRRLAPDADAQKLHLDELAKSLPSGDATRGGELFFGSVAACSTCHAVAQQGGSLGPDLSHIGSIRTPRDLLESIVYPSASFARGYEPYLVKTRDGDVQSGLIVQQTAEAVYLASGPGRVTRILRGQIEQIRPSAVSVMPQGFDAQLTAGQIADLIAFLGLQK